ncbi:DNA repair protein RecN [Sebaldella sp. S0638]|uniref:DNA repair protein RecN n=1 Tax=Sebaldella sp. S0638 TaxID=2957809 RepID=UPI0020A20C2A|nr:DNA repair protein RecN [Sebaldella sp. S0638]MCP1224500.1 DNA repair protein RecN [Sebaldella sp. S0638]
MLRELRLNNLAIIKNVDLNFENGFVALTGETGAGKSIILDGISLLIGERSSSDMIRSGEEKLTAEAVFDLTKEQVKILNDLDFDIEEEELIITRNLSRDGKSKVVVNGMRVPVSKLKEIMSHVLDLVGQHNHQYLLNKNYHLSLLDKFLDKSGLELKDEIKKTIQKISTLSKKINEIEEIKRQIEEKKDIYEFHLSEIDALELKPGEDDELEEEYKILFNAGKIKDKLADSILNLKDSEISILRTLQKTRKNFEQLLNISASYQEVYDNLEKIYYELDDISYTVEDMLDEVSTDENRLETVVSRIDSINKLKMKYGSTIKEILEYKEDIEEKLGMISFENDELDKLKAEKQERTEKYFSFAEKLSKKRKEVAKNIETKLKKELKDLKMENAVFKVHFEKKEELREKGTDSVEFMISANLGEELKPLGKIASGGEISRIMLALKIIFSKVDNISVLIFDEIDTGIAGETVKKVAEKLKTISDDVQVICVTHSPQIAAKGNQQFFIKKEVENKLTETKVVPLNEEERVREIARMISGDNYTDISIQHAKEILGV